MIFALCVTFLALVLCMVAFIKGGAPEKWGAVTFVLAWALTPLVDMQHGIRFGVLIVDSLALVSFILISVKWASCSLRTDENGPLRSDRESRGDLTAFPIRVIAISGLLGRVTRYSSASAA